MNLDKTTSALKKINRLLEIIGDSGDASETEQDLLKAYVKNLYNAVSDGENLETTEEPTKEKPVAEAKPKAAAPAPVVEAAPPVPEPEVVTIATPPASVTPPEPVVNIAPPAAPVPVAVPEAVAASVAPSDKASTSAAPTKGGLGDLFDLEQGSELSDILSSTPVNDLTKAFSINERILTVNELFGGDNEEFKNILVALNGLGSYEEAANVLARSVASKYSWNSEKKHKKAQKFLKLIHRRYN